MISSKTVQRIGMIFCIALACTTLNSQARPSAAQSASEHTVRLIIDYGDGVQKHFTALPWKKDMTVLDAMNQAQMNSHGIKFQNTGSGATAFVNKIDDLQNEGGSGKRNWLFWVNTSLGDKSCGVYKLDPSDVILWKFSAQQMKQ